MWFGDAWIDGYRGGVTFKYESAKVPKLEHLASKYVPCPLVAARLMKHPYGYSSCDFNLTGQLRGLDVLPAHQFPEL